MRRKKRWILASLSALILLNANFIRNCLVMVPYSLWNYENSFLSQTGPLVRVPGGWATFAKDWHPFVMAYDATDGFSGEIGKPAELFIYYNFGAFEDPLHAAVLDEDSPYAGAFYGAYVVRFKEGGTDCLSEETLASILRYDYQRLVLESLGCDAQEMVFGYESEDKETGLSKAGYDGWVRYDGTLFVNGMSHRYKGWKPSYLQYGRPVAPEGADFEAATVHGRLYARTFESGYTIVLYAMALSPALVEETDRQFLDRASIEEAARIR